MLRSSLVASAVAVLCAAASAQNVDLSRVHPITVQVKKAPIYNLQTGKFQTGTQKLTQQNVYKNTCFYINYYMMGTQECEDAYDEGRLPNPGGLYPDHKTNTWEIAYCTSTPTGSVDVDWEVFNTATGGGSACGQYSAAQPVKGSGVAGFTSSTSGFPLPGATTVGSPSCWIVGFTAGTGYACMNSGATSADLFTFRFSQNNLAQPATGLPNGPFLAGNPVAAGAGTFGAAYYVDTLNPGGCGSGLDNDDSFWMNTDNTPIGGTPPATCGVPGGTGGYTPGATGCYWFGGYPTNIFSGFYLRIEGDGSCACTGNVSIYCTGKVNSKGCTPAVSYSGAPSFASCGTQTFNLTASNLVGAKNGLWFYGQAATGQVFHGGYLCVKTGTKRLSVQNTGGAGTTCNGTMTTNFNARICSGSDPLLTAGTTRYAQAWARDPSAVNGDQLSNAVQFTICP
jgi:hypothetical protein